jgi:hypothetical protein
MAKKSAAPVQNLLDAVRPTEADGPLRSAVLSTYGLSLDQPNFFEHDFLPILLGLGGVRDRGYVAPVALERKLADTYCALICDAHALAEGARPSLRVDVIPLARPRHHAKVVLIHRQRLVRVIVSSANLTHDGYRSQREAAAVLDFRPDGGLPPAILDEMVVGWLATLGDAATTPLRTALGNAASAAAGWPDRFPNGSLPSVRVLFGGGLSPLWQQLADTWPHGEPVLSWRICSPFWPGADSQTTPFDKIAGALRQRGASLDQTEIEVICAADVAGERARPVFPFALLRGLRDRGFPVTRGRLVPARLETLDDEVPDRKAEGHRALHAKCVLIRGPETVVALLGSANFTNTGLGISAGANIEAGVLIACPAAMVREGEWSPPLVESGAVDWATCASHDFTLPVTDPDDPVDWPTQLRRVDLDIHWAGPDPPGTLLLTLVAEAFVPTVILAPGNGTDPEPREFVRIDAYPEADGGVVSLALVPTAVRRLLVRRTVRVRWGEPERLASFPINILDTAKAGLPSVLGARPDEQQLLAYFHGRIGEDDLLALLEQRAQQAEGDGPETNEGPPADLQNYLIREFVESLYGLEDTLKTALYSPRALETALLGEFSPAALAEWVLTALRAGRRSATAAAFQLAELLRVVVGLPLGTSNADQKGLEEVRQRAVDRLLGFVGQAARDSPFAGVLRDPHFATYLRASLPRELAAQFIGAATNTHSQVFESHEEAVNDPAS